MSDIFGYIYGAFLCFLFLAFAGAVIYSRIYPTDYVQDFRDYECNCKTGEIRKRVIK